MLVRTSEGMSIRLVASGSPICKKYDNETENILKQMDIKLTFLAKSETLIKNQQQSMINALPSKGLTITKK
jgi:hypothetical protein